MNGRNSRWLSLPVIGLLILLLAACSLPPGVPVSGDGVQADYSGAYATAPEGAAYGATEAAAEAVAEAGASAGADAAAYPTATSTNPATTGIAAPVNDPAQSPTNVPDSVPYPTPDAAQQPQAGEPYLVTQQTAEVRRGPGERFELSHYLDSGVSMAVQGRSEDGQWMAIPGAGNGPGSLGWVRSADVIFYGDPAQVAVIQAPSNPADAPVHSDPGSPLAGACVVEPLPGDPGPVPVRLGPGDQYNVTHRLGGWAEVINTQLGWHQVLLGPGEVGWVNGAQVQTSGSCPQ